MQDFNSFSIIFCYIINTKFQKIGDLFCPVHISGLSLSVHFEARVLAKLLAVTECIISIRWVTDPATLESVSSEISF